MKAAVDARVDPTLTIFARTAVNVTSIDDGVIRARAYEATGVDAMFFTGIRTRAELEKARAATKLPIMLGSTEPELDDIAYLTSMNVRIANQGHAPFAAAALAVHETLKALREGTKPKDLKGLPSAEFTNRYMRNADVQQRAAEFLGLKK
jgi:carboxyvinyl-carboxyphosphonate phosphorylmutase